MEAQVADVAARKLFGPAIADPGLASVRGRNWFDASRDGGFENAIHIHYQTARVAERRGAA
jgi:hypothetical protein